MDRFDLEDKRRTSRRRGRSDMVWNVLAATLLVLTLCMVGIVLTIFMNPSSGWNPFPPETLVPTYAFPTATSTLRMTLEPSWTPTRGIPTATATLAPTNTPLVTATLDGGTPTPEAPAVVATVTPGGYAFDLMEGSPSAIQGDAFRPDLGCDWVGVAGQVVGLNEEPIRSQFIHLGGTLEGDVISLLAITGSAPAYGPAGYEFVIANRLMGTTGTLWIQLEDVQGLPMSERIYFNTYAECEHNLVVIYLKQVR